MFSTASLPFGDPRCALNVSRRLTGRREEPGIVARGVHCDGGERSWRGGIAGAFKQRPAAITCGDVTRSAPQGFRARLHFATAF